MVNREFILLPLSQIPKWLKPLLTGTWPRLTGITGWYFHFCLGDFSYCEKIFWDVFKIFLENILWTGNKRTLCDNWWLIGTSPEQTAHAWKWHNKGFVWFFQNSRIQNFRFRIIRGPYTLKAIIWALNYSCNL